MIFFFFLFYFFYILGPTTLIIKKKYRNLLVRPQNYKRKEKEKENRFSLTYEWSTRPQATKETEKEIQWPGWRPFNVERILKVTKKSGN